MKSISELNDLAVEMMEEIEGGGDSITFTKRAREIIREISDYSKRTELWKENEKRAEEFWKDKQDATPEMVYCYMLERIINAPTWTHMNSSVLLLTPKLDELLNGGESE